MLTLDYKQILDKNKNMPGFVCVHGPSLKKYIVVIEEKQKEGNIRISVSDWWNFFDLPPNYCCIANTELTIDKYFDRNDVDNTMFFYADSADLTNRKKIIDSKLNIFGYDQRHFKNNDCRTITKRYLENKYKNNFIEYGNNKTMWLDGRDSPEMGFAGFDQHGRCCHQKINNRPTLQEYLQKISKSEQHYSTADTVAFHAISFGIILGLNPIYICGLDLNYKLGYANNTNVPYADDEWNKFKRNTLNDLEILNQSAKSRGIKIINLTQNPWYGDKFEIGEL